MLDEDRAMNVMGAMGGGEALRPTGGGEALRPTGGGEALRPTGGEVVVTSHVGRGWREIDRQMRRIAKRRAALDAEEAPVLLAVIRAEVHVHLGYGSVVEYLERACGYAPHTARERVRVAEALEQLPALGAALAAGDVCYSAVKELTRVVTAETEDAWLTAIAGCTVREVQDELRGRRVGYRPEDRPDPAIAERTVTLKLTPAVYALFLEARRAAEREAGDVMTDAEFMETACRRMLDGVGVDERDGVGVGIRDGDGVRDGVGVRDGDGVGVRGVRSQPAHTIAITVCRDCGRGWQETGSKSVELPAAEIERARCDAFELGDVDGETAAPLGRSIPAPIRRAAFARDHHRCVVPGCRSARYLDVHHLTPRAAGGGHELTNVVVLCSRHHAASHAGRLQISGHPGALRFTHADGRPYGAPPRPEPDDSPPDGSPPDGSARHRRP